MKSSRVFKRFLKNSCSRKDLRNVGEMFVRFFIYLFFFSFRPSLFVFETIQFLLREFRGISFQNKTLVFRLIRLRKRLCLLPTKVIVKMNDIALGVDIRAEIVHTVTPIFIRDKEKIAEQRIKRVSHFFFFSWRPNITTVNERGSHLSFISSTI